MNREKILETFFREVKNACEWGVEKDNGVAFSNYIDGMTDFVKSLLENLEDENEITIYSNRSEP